MHLISLLLRMIQERMIHHAVQLKESEGMKELRMDRGTPSEGARIAITYGGMTEGGSKIIWKKAI